METNKLKVVYFGTADFAVPTLAYLAEEHEILAVITQPDRPSGRKMELKPSPVKEKATELGLPIMQPETIASNDEFLELISKLEADFIIVVAYGQIIPTSILDASKYHSINLHGSILPQYRGASPIQQSLLNGDQESGITFIKMDSGIDTGDIIMSQRKPIDPNDNAIDLGNKLAELGGQLINRVLEDLVDGHLAPIPQSDKNVSYCKKINKEDGQIKWSEEDASSIINKMRAFTPWPGCFSFWNGKRVKFLSAKISEDKAVLSPGESQANKDQFIIGTMKGNIEITKIQLEGKSPTNIEDFLRGNPPQMNFS